MDTQHNIERLAATLRLTTSESGVLALSLQGYTPAEVAVIRCVSVRTVEMHVLNIRRKYEDAYNVNAPFWTIVLHAGGLNPHFIGTE